MNKKLLGLAVAAALALPIAAQATVTTYSAMINPIPGSNSGVHGSANLVLDGNMLTVNLTAFGLEPNEIHAQHIHGLVDTSGLPIDSHVPTLKDDSDHDSFVELAEGSKAYGPVLLQLTNPPGNVPDGFPTAPNGQINYHQTFDLSQQAQFGTAFNKGNLLPLEFREIVIHGETVGTQGAGTPGEVNGVPGFKLLLPVADGEIFQTNVSPVPEPEIYGMLLAGLGMIGFVARRRKMS